MLWEAPPGYMSRLFPSWQVQRPVQVARRVRRVPVQSGLQPARLHTLILFHSGKPARSPVPSQRLPCLGLRVARACHLCRVAGVSAAAAAHAVRALHPLGLSLLRQRLLHDGGALHLQRRLLTHEGEGEV